VSELTYKQSLIIGLFQCLAFIPGVSRSASSIVGGLSTKLTREAAAEFSFLLAVPTLTAATGLKLLKLYKTIEPEQIWVIVLGNFVSFIVGAITIKLFLGFLTRHGFFVFGIYRILVGALILALLASGYHLQLM
jgi:undecaprenyl-diphosphatase